MASRSADTAILAINAGASSVKFALFDASGSGSRHWSGEIDRIGQAGGRLRIVDPRGRTVLDEARRVENHEEALVLVLKMVEQRASSVRVVAAGHRIVHGGEEGDRPLLITPAVEARLHKLTPLAPLHQPHNLAGVAALRSARPDLPQVACFDTAFHHSLPRLATLTTLPRALRQEGVRRYGFHGLSYEYVTETLRADGVDLERERIIVAHLGDGASMCALKGGRSIETTMGFSTLAGLPMATRCGDLDPGAVLYLLLEKGITPDQVQQLLYRQCGWLGVSGFSGDMQELLDHPDHPGAVEAVDFFCYQARKHLAGLTAVLGGLDRLVFTGGVGAHAPAVREKICSGLDYLGISLDLARNLRGERLLSSGGGRVLVGAFATDEQSVIARQVRQFHGSL
jgi:acetate kinase